MSSYSAPLPDQKFVVKQLCDSAAIAKLPGYEEASEDLIDAILEGASAFAGEVLAPLNHSGDQAGAKIVNGGVVPAPGFKEAYQQYVEQGWPSLGCDPDFGGQGMPHLLEVSVMEMLQSANLSFALCPMLGQGALAAVESHGSDELKGMFLAQMVSGEWAGTMNLTEPQAGSDLAAVRTKAVPDGAPGERNDVYAVSLEHKLGIHASPTCVMSFGDNGGAVGYLVGEENKGLRYMFTMMNHARLNVGLQGLAVSERAYQLAAAYAKERVQGGGLTIIKYPDIRRMLMIVRSSVEAMRAITYTTMGMLDIASHLPDESARVAAQHYRDARILAIYEGTNGIQALDLVGRKFLRDGGKAMVALIADMEKSAAQLAAVESLSAQAAAFNTGLSQRDGAGRGQFLRHDLFIACPGGFGFRATVKFPIHCAGLGQHILSNCFGVFRREVILKADHAQRG